MTDMVSGLSLTPGLVVLWVLVLTSALAQIGISHQYRVLVNEWQQLEKISRSVTQEQIRLTLELGTLTDFSRIDQRARTELQMIEPSDLRVLQP